MAKLKWNIMTAAQSFLVFPHRQAKPVVWIFLHPEGFFFLVSAIWAFIECRLLAFWVCIVVEVKSWYHTIFTVFVHGPGFNFTPKGGHGVGPLPPIYPFLDSFWPTLLSKMEILSWPLWPRRPFWWSAYPLHSTLQFVRCFCLRSAVRRQQGFAEHIRFLFFSDLRLALSCMDRISFVVNGTQCAVLEQLHFCGSF